MITQNELARKVNRSTMAISRYEEGTIPSPSVIDRIAKAFHIEIHELFVPPEQKAWPQRKVAL
jgi:transcriptional regulator with XRE-family HTH domain